MITEGHHYQYTALRGKHASRYGQVVIVLQCGRTQILVRFPDGQQAHTQRRFLRPLLSL